MSKLPLDLNTEIFRWGPVPGRYFFDSVFAYPYTVLNQRYGTIVWPEALFLCNNGKMLYANENARVVEYGKRAFRDYVLNTNEYKKVYGAWKKANDDLTEMNSRIAATHLSVLSDAKLNSLWQDLRDCLTAFWVPGLLFELANYGSPEMLKEQLAEYITDAAELNQAMELLTSPEVVSFYQEEEIELSESNDIAAHQFKWFWLKNSFYRIENADLDFFIQRKAELAPNLKLKIADHIAAVKRRKDALIAKYHLPADVVTVAEEVWKGLAWQDNRKKYIFINLYYNQRLLAEIARRFNYKLDDLLNIGIDEVSDLLAGKDLRGIVKTRRHKPFGFILETSLTVLSDADAARFWDIYSKDKVVDTEKLTGIVASRGHAPVVQAPVTILHNPAEAGEFPAGHILVAPMTSPEYIFAMKLASAIITDAGGLTSHAAITSRELGIPCIVGTKVATQVLKDGDVVEVDANNGVVKKINVP